MKLFLILTLLLAGPVFTAPAQTNPTATPSTPAAASAPPALSDPFSDPLIQQVVKRHKKAVDGDTAETKSLTADLEKWTKEQPGNHLLQAYLGSVYTLDSRDAWIGPGKLTYLKNGGKELDAAVAADPDNPAVRFVRAIDYFELPAIFGKRQTAREDFQILVKQVEGLLPNAYMLNPETRQGIYYYAGLSDKQLSLPKDAKEAWERGLKLAPNSDLSAKIRAALSDLD